MFYKIGELIHPIAESICNYSTKLKLYGVELYRPSLQINLWFTVRSHFLHNTSKVLLRLSFRLGSQSGYRSLLTKSVIIALNRHLIDSLEAIAMSSIVEVSETGTLQLPAEILQAIQPNTRFVVEVESDRLILSPVPPEQPFWATATPEERAERLMQWVQSHQNGANLPDEALRRENIYD